MKSRFLGASQVEIVNDRRDLGRVRYALFDFDGTLSLIREGWREVMLSWMVEILRGIRTGETEDQIRTIVADFVDRLTGQQTIYQMLQLAEEIRLRGGTPLEPLTYKRLYHDRLWAHISGRVTGLKNGALRPADLVVPGSLDILENLRSRGVTLILASGTDECYVKDEAEALGLAPFFNGGIHGALDRYETFSKKMLIRDLFLSKGLRGPEMVVFGDGFVEIQNAREAGGIAVGVASDEARKVGVNVWKRDRLIGAGADVIVPDHREQDRLVAYLFGEG